MSRTIFNLLRADGSIVINKNLARNIGIDEAIVYSELISKYIYYEEQNMLTEDGFFFVTVEDLQHSTTLSKYQQSKAISELVKLGLITHQNRGVPPKRYFKLTIDNELIIKYLQSPGEKNESKEIKEEKNKEVEGSQTSIEAQKLKNLTYKSEKAEPSKVNLQTPMESQKSKNLTFKSEDTAPLQSSMESQKLKNCTFKSEETKLSKVKKLATNNTKTNNTKKQQQPFPKISSKNANAGEYSVVVAGEPKNQKPGLEQKDLVDELHGLGIGKEKAEELINTYSRAKITNLINYVISDYKIEKKAGFIIKALEKDYILPEMNLQQTEDHLKIKTEKYLRKLKEAEKNADFKGLTKFLQMVKSGKIWSMT